MGSSAKKAYKKGRRQRMKERTKLSLAQGRPPLAAKPQATLSKKATSSAIRAYHDMIKTLAKARKAGDRDKVASLVDKFNKTGGLENYQRASMQGQANDRGGDSSRILLEWLDDVKPTLKAAKSKLRLLEIGALSTNNACSKSALFDVTRIDLEARADGITKQDFMKRPIPETSEDSFDVVSLSLVLNFVPAPEDRGEMLKRTCKFLDKHSRTASAKELRDYFPALFLVLPASCILNSKYTSEERLTLMMASLGYVLLKRKESSKLVYYLWVLRDQPMSEEQNFPKREINPVGQRNNWAIVLRK